MNLTTLKCLSRPQTTAKKSLVAITSSTTQFSQLKSFIIMKLKFVAVFLVTIILLKILMTSEAAKLTTKKPAKSKGPDNAVSTKPGPVDPSLKLTKEERADLDKVKAMISANKRKTHKRFLGALMGMMASMMAQLGMGLISGMGSALAGAAQQQGHQGHQQQQEQYQ